MRKNYLDNIRWIVIVLVVVFHIFFYYNNIGIEAMFSGVPEYSNQITFAGVFQYAVYPWFMLLLFVVAGISARFALMGRTTKQFLKARVDKLLVPSTLGVLAFGWIGGAVIYVHNAKVNMPDNVPGFVGVIIALFSGIGALWFCHVLFVASLLLVLVRILLRKCHVDDEKACGFFVKIMKAPWAFVLLIIAFYLILWGGSHILNMPLITSYRNGIYIPAFFMGFYVFSNDEIIEKLKKTVWVFMILSVLTGVFYIWRCYGQSYTDISVLSRWDLNLFAFSMILFALGASARWLNGSNTFSNGMKKVCFGIYVFHIPVMLLTNYLLIGSGFPMHAIYIIELVSAFAFSLLLNEAVRRIPILRYWILGIRKNKKKKEEKVNERK